MHIVVAYFIIHDAQVPRRYTRIINVTQLQSRQITAQYVKHASITTMLCAYGHSVATLLNSRGVTTVSHKCQQMQDMQLW
jgi:hypothetical protein